jgi:hypothetical protein
MLWLASVCRFGAQRRIAKGVAVVQFAAKAAGTLGEVPRFSVSAERLLWVYSVEKLENSKAHNFRR